MAHDRRTKIHAKVDALGGLLRIELSEGQRHESQMADRIFDGEACDYLLADRAYDSNSFRSNFKNHGVIAVIPSKQNRVLPIPHDCHIYKERHAVECFFQKIKRFRRIATRYDKTARMYLTGILFVSILAILKL